MKTSDIRKLLAEEYKANNIKTSGHNIKNGVNYVELRNVVFTADKPYIIDAPEYPELETLKWYVDNYEPKIIWQIPDILFKLTNDTDTRQAVLSFYNPDEELNKDDMICTMYVSLRLDKLEDNKYGLTYTVHMRSSDIREFRSDVKYHTRVRHLIAVSLEKSMNKKIIENDIIWVADSIQCWDKDWQYL